MKPLLIIGSPVNQYCEVRRTPYFAAMIRRHRFIFVLFICVLILIIFNWGYHRNEKIIFNRKEILYINEYNNVKNPMLASNVDHSSSERKIFKVIDATEIQRNNLGQLDKDEIETFLHLKTYKRPTEFFIEEEYKLFIPLQQKTDEVTTKGMRLENKISLFGDEENSVATRQYLKMESSSPQKDGVNMHAKYLNSIETTSAIHYGKKTVSFSSLHLPDGGFFPPSQNGVMAMTNMTFALSRNRTENIGILHKGKHIQLNDQKSSPMELKVINKYPVYLIDTLGCKIPRLDPWDPSVKDLIELQKPYDCPGPPVFMKSYPGGSITFNKTILGTYYNITPEELVCFYQPIHRKYEEEWSNHRELAFAFGNKYPLSFEVPLNEDFVATSCDIKGKNYIQYLSLARLKKKVEKEKISMVPPNPKLNVILLGIDSVSKLNFIRHFPKTQALLRNKLHAFEMRGYNKVGDNTFPNIVPLLTGQFPDYWWNETMKDSMFFDDVEFIWKKYAERGYRTFFAEDNPFFGIFNYLKRGFYNPPTDYYFRPMALALEMLKVLLNSEKKFCLNSETMFDIIFDYLKVFTQTMKSRSYFSFAMVSTLTHDVLNNAGWADEPTERLLEGLLNTGALNNTILVLFSDHGMRFGEIRETFIGKYEERLPLMYIHVPKWFLDQYPEIAKNLQTNKDRLMTIFDIDATMIHLLDLNKTHQERSIFGLGSSLFEEISPNRTCLDANIQTHWCTCQSFDIIDLNNLEVINASHAIVNDINHKLEPYKKDCESLQVDTIMDARIGRANKKMLYDGETKNEPKNATVSTEDDVTSFNDYMITLVTKPGGGVFEGTVRHNQVDDSYSVLGVSRINMYGNSSWCIDSQSMKIFCICKIQQVV